MIRIVQGNDVNIHVPLMEKNADGTTTPIDFANVSGLEVHLSRGSEAFNDFTIYTANNTVIICLNENAPVGAYSILITAKNNGVDICYNEKCAFAIVTYNGDSTYIDYIADEDVTLDTALFVAAIVNDAQVEELRAELQAKIAETEASKAAYDEAAENLVDLGEDLGGISETVENAVEDAMQGADVAKQGTDPTATLTAVKQILDNLDISQVAKQGTDPTATNTAILSAIAALATAVGLIPTNPATSTDVNNAKVALQGNDTTATLTALATAIANINIPANVASSTDVNNAKVALQGSDTTATLTALKTLVSAISGYALQGTDSTATNTAIKTLIQAINGYALQGTDATATNTAIKNLVSAITGYALQGTDPTATNTAIKNAIANIDLSNLALQGTDPTATNTAILSAIIANAGTPQLTIPNTTLTQELAPNTVYLFESRTNNLTLTLGTPIAGQNNEYHFFVFVGATVPSITYPAGISWNGGSAPTITANKNYEISINNNIAAYFEI